MVRGHRASATDPGTDRRAVAPSRAAAEPEMTMHDGSTVRKRHSAPNPALIAAGERLSAEIDGSGRPDDPLPIEKAVVTAPFGAVFCHHFDRFWTTPHRVLRNSLILHAILRPRSEPTMGT